MIKEISKQFFAESTEELPGITEWKDTELRLAYPAGSLPHKAPRPSLANQSLPGHGVPLCFPGEPTEKQLLQEHFLAEEADPWFCFS